MFTQLYAYINLTKQFRELAATDEFFAQSIRTWVTKAVDSQEPFLRGNMTFCFFFFCFLFLNIFSSCIDDQDFFAV